MVPITPAGRFESGPKRSRPLPRPADDAADLASANRPLASHANLRSEEIAAVRRSLVVALAAICLITATATGLAVFSPAMRTLLAFTGP